MSKTDENSVVANNTTTVAGQYFLCRYGNDHRIKIRRKSSDDCVSDELSHYEARQ